MRVVIGMTLLVIITMFRFQSDATEAVAFVAEAADVSTQMDSSLASWATAAVVLADAAAVPNERSATYKGEGGRQLQVCQKLLGVAGGVDGDEGGIGG